MAGNNGPRIVTSGLVLALDAADRKSYSGSGTAWNDLSGNNNNGTLTNGPTFDSTNGGCINFDGVDDYTNLGNNLTYTTGNFSFCNWIYTNTLTTTYYTLFKKGTNYEYTIRNNTFQYSYSYSSGSSTLGIPISFITSNNWYFIASSRNGTSHVFYIYGPNSNIYELDLADISSQQDPLSNSNNFLIAYNDSATYSPIKVASLLNYNRNLSKTEILQNFNATRGRFGI